MRFLGHLAAAAIICLAPAAYADARSEAYVEKHANAVLQVLNDKSLSQTERSQKFSEYMHQFAHVPTIARRVLGVHGRALSDAQFDRYYEAFETYAITVYEVQLDQFRGESIRVTGSTDIDARRSQVRSLIKSSESGRDVEVIWDVLMSQDGATYRVRDVGLNISGSVIWLAQDQQAQFESYLDRNNGDVNRLVTRINQMVADLNTKAKSGTAPSFGGGAAQSSGG